MSKKIIASLDDMTPEEIDELKEALASRENKKPKRKQKRNRRKGLDKDEEDVTIMSKPKGERHDNSRGRRKRSDGDDFDKNEHRRRRSNKGSSQGSQARTESVDLDKTRTNKFFEQGFHKQANPDKEMDKKLYGNNPQSMRKVRQTVMDDVECSGCGRYHDNISVKFISRGEDGNVRFVCDQCILSKR